MVSTAIGLAIGSLVLVSSILLFVSLWNTYFTTYINAIKAYAEKASYMSKAKITILDVNVTMVLRGSRIEIKGITIDIANNGSVPVVLKNNFTFILIKCLDRNRIVHKSIGIHTGRNNIDIYPPIIEPGEVARIKIDLSVKVRRLYCSYMDVIVVTSNGLRALKTISIS